MDRPSLIRGLRIAWTVSCGILCVLVVALWVRSFSSWDRAFIASRFACDSIQGKLLINVGIKAAEIKPGALGLPAGVTSNIKSFINVARPIPNAFGIVSIPVDGVTFARIGSRGLAIPYWALVCGIAAIAALPPRRWRYKLRTLLIATTLIAVVLATAASLRLW